MNPSPIDLNKELTTVHQLLADYSSFDTKTLTDASWTIVKSINGHTQEIGSVLCRQLLADYLQLPLSRPSNLHSAVLGSAMKVANLFTDFRFIQFLKMWDIRNLRPEDWEPTTLVDNSTGKVRQNYPSLLDRLSKTYAIAKVIRPDDSLPEDQEALINNRLEKAGIMKVQRMIVTRIKEATNKQGKKLRFVTLMSPDGIEVECIANQLQPNPTHPLPEGKRLYANVGQLYDCLLRCKGAPNVPDSVYQCLDEQQKLVPVAPYPIITYLSSHKVTDHFPTEIGYVEHIDTQHNHIHIYDKHSRHLVAPLQRFSRDRVGDFVRFVPIIPKASKFKSAIILSTVPSSSEEVKAVLREIRITNINKDKGYAAWELVDKDKPITELLSPLQLSQGEISPSFTSGYLNLTEELSSSSTACTEPVEVSSLYKALIFLKRGKDRKKRPHVARLFLSPLF